MPLSSRKDLFCETKELQESWRIYAFLFLIGNDKQHGKYERDGGIGGGFAHSGHGA